MTDSPSHTSCVSLRPILLAELSEWQVGREFDGRTGYKELVIRGRSGNTAL